MFFKDAKILRIPYQPSDGFLYLENVIFKLLILNKFVHSINILGRVETQISFLKLENLKPLLMFSGLLFYSLVITRTVFRWKILVQISASTRTFKQQITHNILCFLISCLFHIFQDPCVSGSGIFRIQFFQGLGFSVSGSRVKVQGPGPVFRSRQILSNGAVP